MLRQPRTMIALFASMAFVAVMMGLLVGRACHAPKPRPVVAAPVTPAPTAPIAIDPHAPLAPPVAFEDAGVASDALPIVALAPRDAMPRARPAPRAAPRVIVDAGAPRTSVVDPVVDPVVAPVVDAGSAPAATSAASASAVRPELAADAMPSAPLVIMYRDDLSWLKLIELRVFLNGKRVIDDKPTDANRPARGERKLFETRLFPGHHQVRIETTYMGEDSGIFDYMSAVRVRMREMIVVEVDATHGATVQAHAFDRGALEPWEKRPGLKLSATAR
jgi:hypothetical protein